MRYVSFCYQSERPRPFIFSQYSIGRAAPFNFRLAMAPSRCLYVSPTAETAIYLRSGDGRLISEATGSKRQDCRWRVEVSDGSCGMQSGFDRVIVFYRAVTQSHLTIIVVTAIMYLEGAFENEHVHTVLCQFFDG